MARGRPFSEGAAIAEQLLQALEADQPEALAAALASVDDHAQSLPAPDDPCFNIATLAAVAAAARCLNQTTMASALKALTSIVRAGGPPLVERAAAIPGLLQDLTAALAPDQPENVAANAAAALKGIARAEGARGIVAAAPGVAGVLAAALARGGRAGASAAWALESLAQTVAGAAAIASTDGAVAQLAGGEQRRDGASAAALLALWALLRNAIGTDRDDPARPRLCTPAVFSALAGALMVATVNKSPEELTAAHALARACAGESVAVRRAVDAHGVLDSLVYALASRNTQVAKHAAIAFRRLALKGERLALRILEAGALPRLLALAGRRLQAATSGGGSAAGGGSAGDVHDAAVAALDTLGAIASRGPSAAAAAAPEGGGLLPLLRDAMCFPACAATAAGVVADLATASELTALRAAGCEDLVKILAALLLNPDNADTMVNAAAVLGALTEHGSAARRIVEASDPGSDQDPLFLISLAVDSQITSRTENEHNVGATMRVLLTRLMRNVDRAAAAAATAPAQRRASAGPRPAAATRGNTASSQDAQRTCAACGKARAAAGLRACTACRRVWYCGPDCQRAGWHAGHKDECKAWRAQGGEQA